MRADTQIQQRECLKVVSSAQEEEKLNCPTVLRRCAADVLVKSQERVTPSFFLTSQRRQKFFQVSFCVAEDDNGESINA